jgi:sugar phosphate isomerase/epimerase
MDGTMTRRDAVGRVSGTIVALARGGAAAARTVAAAGRLGIGEHSYGIRIAAERGRPVADRFGEPLNFLEHAHQLGAGGIQLSLGTRPADATTRLQTIAADHGMFVEGSVRLPADDHDTARFESEVRTARQAGAAVVRTVTLSGRRYEVFDSAESFGQFADQAWRSLTRAEPIVARHRMRLAVENHKDWRVPELLELLRRLSSEYVGVCVDTGNSIALLEDPMGVVESYAPWAFAVHLKDMAVREYDEGFLLSEVPLGDGFLDLPRIVQVLTKARPEVRFNLEMLTRDPLRVPCLTPKYWATCAELPGRQLADTLMRVRRHAWPKPLPQVSPLEAAKRQQVEEENVIRSLAFARERLGL